MRARSASGYRVMSDSDDTQVAPSIMGLSPEGESSDSSIMSESKDRNTAFRSEQGKAPRALDR
jgi:hypothetical protein